MEKSLTVEIIKTVGKSVPLMYEHLNEDKYKFDLSELKSILCGTSVAKKKIAVISVIGSVRRGKSFLMNFLLRYLNGKCAPSWSLHLDQAMEGFPWNCGLSRKTIGVAAWSEPFTMKIEKEEVVVLLVDTQGMFGRYNSADECTITAALSLLMSSCQLLNIESGCDESMTDFIEVFINYAHMITDKWSIKNPFQNMMAIFRDWIDVADYPLGIQGGETYMTSSMSSKASNSQHPQFKKYYKKLFNKIQCCMLPHPGLKASNNPNFDGRLRDLEPLFLEQLKILVPAIVCPENLPLKKINDHCLTCKEFFHYFKALVTIINENSWPKISHILIENGNLNKWELFENMSFLYISEMDKFFERELTFISTEKLLNEHIRTSKLIKENLDVSRKFNSSVIYDELNSLMFTHLKNMQMKFSSENANKNMKMGILTPYALIILLAIFFFFFHLVSCSHIQIIITVAEILFYLSLSFVLLWIGACWTQIEELGSILDEIADILIFYVYNPIIILLKNKPTKLFNSFYESMYFNDDAVS